MSNSHYTIRNYQPADFDRFVQLSMEVEKLEPSGRCLSRQAIAENLGRPNYSPEQDLLVVEAGQEIVGYMDMKPELAIGRVILDCRLHPEHRRRGLATRLFSRAIHRAEEVGARAAHINIAENNLAAKGVLSKLGFKYVRRFLELRLD